MNNRSREKHFTKRRRESKAKVSVIVPLFNRVDLVTDTIRSVKDQTNSGWELLIIDDASNDGSAEIIQSYHDSRIRVHRNPTNRGPGYSRKKALKVASGEYIAILDADDVAFKERLGVQVDYLDRNLDIQLVGSAYEAIDEDGNVECAYRAALDPLGIRWELLFGNCMTHSTVMFRRAAALAVGNYDDRTRLGEDFDLYVRLSTRGQIAQLDRPLVQWRRHSHGCWQGASADVQDYFVAATVAKSIYLQTGRAVNLEVARCLARDTTPRSPHSEEVVRTAYATIANCLDCVVASAKVSTKDRKKLLSLALRDIFRIVNQNPASSRYACRAAVVCLAKHNLHRLLEKRFLKMVLIAVLPRRAIDVLRRIKNLILFSAFRFVSAKRRNIGMGAPDPK